MPVANVVIWRFYQYGVSCIHYPHVWFLFFAHKVSYRNHLILILFFCNYFPTLIIGGALNWNPITKWSWPTWNYLATNFISSRTFENMKWTIKKSFYYIYEKNLPKYYFLASPFQSNGKRKREEFSVIDEKNVKLMA